jgi:hypothetical protein
MKTLLFFLALAVAFVFWTSGLLSSRASANTSLAVTGSATANFESDLAVWRGSFSQKAPTTKEAFEKLKSNTAAVKAYLLQNGVPDSGIVFSSVKIEERTEDEYTKGGGYRSVFVGYDLTQTVTVQSTELDKIDKISRSVSDLIEQGVEFFSDPPEYYYTKIDELKLDLVAKATENAHRRAEIMAENAGAKLKSLRAARLGVFQITGIYDATDSYASGGAYDTRSRQKTAFITARVDYLVE